MRRLAVNLLLFVLALFALFLLCAPEFWFFLALAVLLLILAVFGAIRHAINRAGFGARMTLDEICKEEDPVRVARLLRYHLGWSPGKIAAELNRLGYTNYGLPWRESDARHIVGGIRRIWPV